MPIQNRSAVPTADSRCPLRDERQKIAAWLRRRLPRSVSFSDYLDELAARIERGEHLVPEEK